VFVVLFRKLKGWSHLYTWLEVRWTSGSSLWTPRKCV